MVRVRVAVAVLPPPVAVILIGKVVRLADLDAVTNMETVPDPGAAMGLGEKLTVTPDSIPDAVKEIGALKPPDTVVVTVAVPESPRGRLPAVGETATVKVPAPVVEVTVTVAVAVWLPEAAVPVMTTL